MSIETFLTAAYFKRDQAGRTIVYPFGALGRGYFVPDVVTEQRTRRKVMWGVIAVMVIALAWIQAFQVFYGRMFNWTAEAWAIAVTTLTLLQCGYLFWLKRLVRDMAPAAERLRLAESLTLTAQVWPRWLLRGLAWSQIVGAICAGISLVMMPSLMGVALSVLCVLAFGLFQTMLRFSRPSPQMLEQGYRNKTQSHCRVGRVLKQKAG